MKRELKFQHYIDFQRITLQRPDVVFTHSLTINDILYVIAQALTPQPRERALGDARHGLHLPRRSPEAGPELRILPDGSLMLSAGI